MITKVNDVDTQCNILSGVYISPWSKSLLTENSGIIQGYMLDTTWKVMSLYVTSILMGSCFNIWMPLTFSFGHSEVKNMFLELLRTFEEQVQVDLHGQIIISDQGTALKSAISEFEMIYLACLRHLLAFLKFDWVTFLIGELIKSVSDVNLNTTKAEMEKSFAQIDDINVKKLLTCALKKCGLQYENGVISIKDEDSWKSISMKERLPYRMPSTTNVLESTHRYLNKKTPRNNNFFASVHRLIYSVMKRAQQIEEYIYINYVRMRTNTLKTMNNTSIK